jgi:hypothetical protein
MATISDFPARGIVTSINGSVVVFNPTGTNYQIHLNVAEGSEVPAVDDRPVEGLIRATARKLWSVPTGGNFIEPIFGRPRIIQGRVKWLDEQMLVIQAGTMFAVEMPVNNDAIDLANGPIETGALVNVTVMAGATIQIPVPPPQPEVQRVYVSRSAR